MTSNDQHRYLVAYDIVDDRRRTKIAKVLESYGDRIQYSVFVVDIKPARYVRLVDQLRTIMILDQDSILVCDLGPLAVAIQLRFDTIGVDRPLTQDSTFVI